MNNPRYIIVQTLLQVLPKDKAAARSLNQCLPENLLKAKDQDKAFISATVYGVLRFYPSLLAQVNTHLQKPLRTKDKDILLLLASAYYQLEHMRTADHAAVSESVNVCKLLKKEWAKGLVNGVLRNLLREIKREKESKDNNTAIVASSSAPINKSKSKTKSPEEIYNHPQWIIDTVLDDWQEDLGIEKAECILLANNIPAPMTLRLNKRLCQLDDYLDLLKEKNLSANASENTEACLYLEKAVDVHDLPGFSKGWVSVQDEAAQQAAYLLNLKNEQRVLDACAAPGGKTGHILEQNNTLKLISLDSDSKRLEKVKENLERLDLSSQIICADLGDINGWWDHKSFDRILLDAPCSASGIIRRHPDIKWLRRQEDILNLAKQQKRILEAVWQTLKPGGQLLYATCSVFKKENEEIIGWFLAKEASAREIPISCQIANARPHGVQIFPNINGHDGFYYACLEKL